MKKKVNFVYNYQIFFSIIIYDRINKVCIILNFTFTLYRIINFIQLFQIPFYNIFSPFSLFPVTCEFYFSKCTYTSLAQVILYLLYFLMFCALTECFVGSFDSRRSTKMLVCDTI